MTLGINKRKTYRKDASEGYKGEIRAIHLDAQQSKPRKQIGKQGEVTELYEMRYQHNRLSQC